MFRSLHAVVSRLSLSAIAPALVCCGLLLVCTAATAQTPPSSIVPTDRLQEPWWAQRHAQVLEQVKQHADTPLLLIGDSITQNYDKAQAPDENFQPTWQTFYGSRGALNLGFSGDGTEHVLWRLANGEVDGLHPKVAVVLIGTNNTGHLQHTAEQTQLGIDAVVAAIEQKLPRTHILLLGVLPSAVSAEKSRRDAQVNQALAVRYGDNPRVTYLDVGSIFLRDGALRTAVLRHPLPPAGRCAASGHAGPAHAGGGHRADPGEAAGRAAGQAGRRARPRRGNLADPGRLAGAGLLRLVRAPPRRTGHRTQPQAGGGDDR